jgi:hypothetical protein
VISRPPLLAVATGVHVTTELASWLDAAATPTGAAGTVNGTRSGDGSEYAPVSVALFAATRKE